MIEGMIEMHVMKAFVHVTTTHDKFLYDMIND